MDKYLSESLVSTKEGFGKGLLEAAKNNEQIIGLGSDITSSVGMNYFADHFPERFYSLGIAEQNAVGVAAGMALSGMLPVFSTYAVFAAMRTLDQIRVSLCYNKVHAIIGGAHAGISVGPDGATHQALEDIAALNALPNMVILNPCDANQCKNAVLAATKNHDSPIYIRFGRAEVANFTKADAPFEIGKAETLIEGNDITIIATGHMVWEALIAAKELQNQGINAEVINVHTLKPLDTESILQSAKKTNLVLTAEEHQINGGLGSIVATFLSQHHPVKIAMVAMNDCFGESGQPQELMEKYGLNHTNILAKARNLIDEKHEI